MGGPRKLHGARSSPSLNLRGVLSWNLAIMLATIGITIDDGNCGQVRPKDAFFMVGIASQPLVFINSLS